MNRNEFIRTLRRGLSGLSPEEIEAQVNFYNEMIDDRMEEGLTEEAAIAQIGPVEQIVGQTVLDAPPVRKKRSLGALEIVLLVLGSPIWISLLAAAFVVVLAGFVVLWSVVISLWAVEVSLGACALAGVAAIPIFAMKGYALTGIALGGCGLFCAGLSIFGFYGCKSVAKLCVLLCAKTFSGIKSLFVKKEVA